MSVIITKKQIETYVIQRKWLDEMRVSIEPFKRDDYQGGVVIVACADTQGMYTWGSCGCGIKEFLTRIGFDYWSKKLFPDLVNSQYLQEETEKAFLSQVTELRRENELDRKQARALYDYIKDNMPTETSGAHWVAHWIMDKLRDFADSIGKPNLYDDWEFILIQKTCDSHILHIWYKGWLPFIQELCKELKIEYKEPWSPECSEIYKTTPEDLHVPIEEIP